MRMGLRGGFPLNRFPRISSPPDGHRPGIQQKPTRKPEACIMAEEQHPEQSIETITRWLLKCAHAVAFTGAGISTESGIPDFRGPDGVWTRRDAGLPAPQWRVRPDQDKPNSSHLALA